MASNTDRPTGAATGTPVDTLSRAELRRLYEWTARQLAAVPGMQELFDKAFQNQWDQRRFNLEVENLPWYQENASSVREYILAQAQGGADWDKKVSDSNEFVRRTAMQLGVNLSDEQISDLSQQSLMYGWGDQGKQYLLQRKMAEIEPEGEFGGDIEKNADTLRAMAMVNGVKFSEGWYASAGKSVALGLSNPDDWKNQIREQAASRFPAYADQILAGLNVRDIASPYIQTMQDELGLNANDVMLDDPLLLNGIAAVGEGGSPAPLSLGDFARTLRQDPRWKNTDKAQNSITGAASAVMQMFGLRG